jgi:hypothetical protein
MPRTTVVDTAESDIKPVRKAPISVVLNGALQFIDRLLVFPLLS